LTLVIDVMIIDRSSKFEFLAPALWEQVMPLTQSRRSRCRSLLVIALVAIMVTQSSPSALAWGPLGHRVITKLTERKLNPKAKATVAALLEQGETMADASTWADEHLRDVAGSGPWHYVDVPLDEAKYDAKFSGEVPEKGCIVAKINEFKKALKDPAKSIEQRRLALRFLIHLIEDLHMPLHVGDNHDKGGNKTQVRFFDDGTNMHRLWDSGMILRVGDTEDFWVADLSELDTPNKRNEAMRGTVEDWATESLLLAKAAYQVPETGKRLKPGQKLSDAYLNTHLPVVRKRLYQASIRLAMVLNETFPEQ
jgi:nuclease S1